MPISGISVLDPLMQVYAAGWMYHKAVHSSRSWLILVGMWLIFGPAVLIPGALLAGWTRSITNPFQDVEWSGILGLAISGGFLILYAAILWKITARHIRALRTPANHCQEARL
jgi:hypothetical protein